MARNLPTPRTTDALIEDLVQDLTPVRRLPAPMVRAAVWLCLAGLAGGGFIALFSNWAVMAARLQRPELIVELAGTLGTGILAVIAAFQLTLPDRSRRWMLLPLPTLALWLAGSGAGCLRHLMDYGSGDWAVGESMQCLRFILGLGLPLGAALLWALRRARPIAPGPVAAMGGLGGAALAAFMLQFFHPFDVTIMDLAIHVIAVGIVIGLATLSRRPVLGAA